MRGALSWALASTLAGATACTALLGATDVPDPADGSSSGAPDAVSGRDGSGNMSSTGSSGSSSGSSAASSSSSGSSGSPATSSSSGATDAAVDTDAPDGPGSACGPMCPTSTCCGTSCQTQHSDGVGQSFYDCSPSSAYDAQTAVEACEAFVATIPFGSIAQCTPGWMCQGTQSVCISSQSGCGGVCWSYMGTNAGAVTDCSCPGKPKGTWN